MLMPGARLALIDQTHLDEMDAHDVVVFHTGVGHDPFSAAHLSVGSLGEITQSRDDRYQSAACLDGNPRCLAVETEDMGDPFPVWSGNDVPAWTDAQVHSNARIAAWAHLTRGIPLAPCPDSRPGSRGIGWHRLGIDGNFVPGVDYPGRVPGGEHWSTKFGKGCPGNRRIRQVLERVIPLARLIVSLPNDQRWRVIAGKEPIPGTAPAAEVLPVPPDPIPEEEIDMLFRPIVFVGERTTPASGTNDSTCAILLPGKDGVTPVWWDVTTNWPARTSGQVNFSADDLTKWAKVDTTPAGFRELAAYYNTTKAV